MIKAHSFGKSLIPSSQRCESDPSPESLDFSDDGQVFGGVLLIKGPRLSVSVADREEVLSQASVPGCLSDTQSDKADLVGVPVVSPCCTHEGDIPRPDVHCGPSSVGPSHALPQEFSPLKDL
jgi:hypothetical protein